LLCALALIVAAVTYAQVTAVQPVTPMVISGADFGFRIEGMRGNTAVGTLVVQRDGQWITADPTRMVTRPLATH
jgi:hypothetical protein